MKLFHRTWAEFADSILTSGFLDGIVGYVQTSSPVPLDATDINTGSGGDVVLVVDVPSQMVSDYEDHETHYRTRDIHVFNVPADVLNAHNITLYETDYSAMSESHIIASMQRTQNSDYSRPGAPYNQTRVLESALAFLKKYEGNDEQRRRTLTARQAYADWETQRTDDYWGNDQHYWYVAAKKIAAAIDELGFVPFF